MVPWDCLKFVIVVFPDHTHLHFCCICWGLVFSTSCLRLYCVISSLAILSSSASRESREGVRVEKGRVEKECE